MEYNECRETPKFRKRIGDLDKHEAFIDIDFIDNTSFVMDHKNK